MKLTSGMVDNENVLLCEKLSLYPEKTKFKVSVTSTRVVIDRLDGDKSEEVILLDDVIGCHILQDKKRNVTTAYVCIFSYPLKKKRLGSGVIRQRNAKTLTVDVKKSYQENLLLAETWKMTIKRLITGEKITTKEDIENGSLAARNLLVLINPFSGRKKAASIYKEKVRPMFTEAEIRHTVRKTEYPGHAKEMAKQINIDDWDGIVIISGDGLVHEVMNGLMDRPDWKTAISMPIGIVPGGSGNALAAAIVYASTGLHSVASPSMCAFEICRGTASPMDLVAVEISDAGYCNQSVLESDTPPRRIIYSFMDVVLGLIADIDIESEGLRCLGGDLRNMVYAIIRILSLRWYDFQISYLPFERSDDRDSDAICNGAGGGGDSTSLSRKVDSENQRGFSLIGGLQLPPLDEELPEGWITEEGPYVMVMANYLSHIAQDALCQVKCKLKDGRIFLNLSDQTTTRLACFDAWGRMERGVGLKDETDHGESVGRTVECLAFRVVPKGGPSKIITVDGEKIPHGPLQCVALPGIARVMTSLPKEG